jgi:cytochrome o ubiquinol oxidase subunit 2
MAFDVHAVPPEQFTQWAAATRATGPVLDEAAYRELLKQTQNVSPYTYRSVQAGLFDDIVEQRLPPGEGPPAVPVPRRAPSSVAALAGRQH